MNRYICIHGHYYQPPRENAWLESIEIQESAAPFHDWNDRINFECYAPNAASRLLDEKGHIRDIQNNYSKMSFNFGPTLLSWLETADPETYEQILEADRLSVLERGGHGNAMAQAHSHLILPLANEHDKETQVVWGIRDFVKRFKRYPEGMWLAETAMDTPSLEVLARNGIKFTIAAPRQAKAIRKIGEQDWRNVNEALLDTRKPYICHLPSGHSIVVFFYHGDASQAVAFEGILNNGKAFAERLTRVFSSDKPGQPELVHIATDGESYGHHHKHGDMALAYCLHHLEESGMAKLTNYGQYLDMFPPEYEVMIHENSSWSCVHGVERWRSNCGCNSGAFPSQAWRGPLRDSLDWLRDQLIPVFEKQGEQLFKNPWAARNSYIDVILNRSDANMEDFITHHSKYKLSQDEKTHALRLLEMQRNALYMYTSCGWFFDEVSGIETNQILQYACRAISYAEQVANLKLEPEFLARLSKAPSNLTEIGTGAESYRRNVIPARVDLTSVGMHFAVSSIFENEPERLPLFNYVVSNKQFNKYKAGSQVLAIGRTVVRSRITHSEKLFSFAVLYLGQHNIIGNISTDMSEKDFNEMADALRKAFSSSNLGELIAIMQKFFGADKYSLRHLFKDAKRDILNRLLTEKFKEVSTSLRDIYEDNYQLMTAFTDAGIAIPEAYQTSVAYVLNQDLMRYAEEQFLSVRELKRLAYEFKKWNVKMVEADRLKLIASKRVLEEIQRVAEGRISIEDFQRLNFILAILKSLKFDFDKWKIQNFYYRTALQKGIPMSDSPEWKRQFRLLGENVGVRLILTN